MSIEYKSGKSIGAAIALSAAVFLSPNAYAMSELEELMGEPVEALSDNELGELRGGFVTVNGLKFNIGVEVTQAVNGRILRTSNAVLGRVQNRMDQLGRNVMIRRREDAVEQIVSDEVIETSVDGAPVVSNSTVTQVSAASVTPETMVEASTTTNTGAEQTATLTDDTMTFNTADMTAGEEAAVLPPEGVSTSGALPSSVFEVQMGVIETDNSNVLLNRVINLDIANYSMIDAMAARARVESQITNVVNSQILFQLGRQF